MFKAPPAVRLRRPEATSALASRTRALFAAPAPLVMPSSFSKSVSFKSAEPMMNEVPAVIAPVPVTLRRPAMSMLLSATRALDAAAVPAVMPSSISNSASTSTAEPSVIPAAEMTPVAVRLRRPEMSMFASATRALDAAAVPLVIPSSFSRSASLRSALPITKEPTAVTEPPKTAAPRLLTVAVPPPSLRLSKEARPEPETMLVEMSAGAIT